MFLDLAGLDQHQKKEEGHVLPVLLLTSRLGPSMVWGTALVLVPNSESSARMDLEDRETLIQPGGKIEVLTAGRGHSWILNN